LGPRAPLCQESCRLSEIRPDLGEDFIFKIVQALKRIADALRHWPIWPSLPKDAPEIHRVLVKRFPFGVANVLLEDVVVVLAIVHLHAEPFYWLSRASEQSA
jgi:hypothetical protein